MRVAIGTKFFDKNPENIQKIIRFAQKAREIGDLVLVAVNVAEDKTNAIEVLTGLNIPGVEAFPVTPWGKFVTPLNAIVLKAALAGASQLLLASVEVAESLTPENIQKLSECMIPGYEPGKDFQRWEVVLVTGVAMIGHEFGSGIVVGNGRTVPWNTFALWNLDYLSRIGFPLIGDAPFDSSQAGVEEVTTIALLMKLYPGLTAKLITIPGVEWDVSSFDPERLKKHQVKMATKVSRPAAQMERLDFVLTDVPLVRHIRS